MVKNNSVGKTGGGIYLQYSETINISNSNIKNNSAKIDGGGLYFLYG